MLHILLLILKIIGIILLALLGIMIVTLCMVVFVPAVYRIEMKDKKIEAKASWFFRLLYAYYVQDGKNKEWQVRVGWKRLNNEEKASATEEFAENTTEEVEEDSEKPSAIEENSPEENGSEESEMASNKSKKKTKKKQKWFDKIKCTIKKICDKIKQILDTKDKLIDFLTDEVHVAGFQKAKKEVLVLLRRIRPRKIQGGVRFGMEDPYHTGQILAGLSMLYPFYGEQIEIIPDFEQKVLEGNLYIHGRIHVITLIITLYNLFLDENIRKTWNHFKRLRG